MLSINNRSLFAAATLLLLLGASRLYAADVPGVGIDANGNPSIVHIGQFLDACPHSDPAVVQIRNDFQIRRNGVVVGNIGCASPVSQMPVAQYTDELIVLQSLRVMYYMDRGYSGHLPWASGSFYDWMKTKVQGIDIRDDSSTAWCCYQLDDRNFFVVRPQDDFNRQFDHSWEGISGNIALYGHEARHMDNQPHAPCGDPPYSKDQFYDQNSISAYGVQYWMSKLWLTGGINVGMACLPEAQARSARDWLDMDANNTFHFRFCDNTPPIVPVPAVPGGACPSSALLWAAFTSYAINARVIYNGIVYEASQAHHSLPHWTPTQAVNLWHRPTPSGITTWDVQTQYVVGSEVLHEGARYRAIEGHVSQADWSPAVSRTLWLRY